MSTSHTGGFAETAAAYEASAGSDFVQAERDRLRAGLLDAAAAIDRNDPRLAEALRLPIVPMDAVSAARLHSFAELWRTRHQVRLRELAHGTAVQVDFASGLFVTADKRWAASDRLDAVFGTRRSAWSFEHGVAITLGGGLWALNSEA